MLRLELPLSPEVLKKFEKDIKDVYYVLNSDFLNKLIEKQDKNIDICSFTKGSSGLSVGIKEDANLLIKLDGKTSFKSDVDMVTETDKDGVKWLFEFGDVPKNGGDRTKSVISEFFSKPMEKLIIEKYKNFDEDEEINDIDDMESIVDWMSEEDKLEFIDFYNTEAKKLITEDFMVKLQGNLKKIKPSGRDDIIYDNNELLLHNFQIKKIYWIKDAENKINYKDFKDIESIGFPMEAITKEFITNIKEPERKNGIQISNLSN